MNRDHFVIAFCPNLIIFLMIGMTSYTTLIYAFPKIISKSSQPSHVYFYYLLGICNLFMFVWCWIYTISSDPGRIADDLQQRGLLDKINRGDIPPCLHHLPLCEKCNVPMPPNSFHCKICKTCHLRYDHHCGVVGQCIADKNMKSFVLSFFYGSIFGIVASFTCFYYSFKLNSHDIMHLNASEKIVFIIGIYCVIITLFLISFCGSMIFNEAVFLYKNRKKVTFSKLLKIFGNKRYKIMIPVQNESSHYAWLGVFWFDDYEP